MSSQGDGHDARLAAPEVSVEADGRLTVPADHVTALLRSIARTWQASTGDGTPVLVMEEDADIRLEPVTVRALAHALDNIANQLDVQYIHIATRMSHTE
ncbi:hypothetical protein [Streptomyces sp. NPDC059814]|uniref:hypothetical protein n=1 Tax=Streptomyces sp. NPDC059814 TaxID=3346959 RepID=UPI0036588469